MADIAHPVPNKSDQRWFGFHSGFEKATGKEVYITHVISSIPYVRYKVAYGLTARHPVEDLTKSIH